MPIHLLRTRGEEWYVNSTELQERNRQLARRINEEAVQELPLMSKRQAVWSPNPRVHGR